MNTDTLAAVMKAATTTDHAATKLRQAVTDAHAAGHTITDIADAAGVTRQTVYRWINERTHRD